MSTDGTADLSRTESAGIPHGMSSEMTDAALRDLLGLLTSASRYEICVTDDQLLAIVRELLVLRAYRREITESRVVQPAGAR